MKLDDLLVAKYIHRADGGYEPGGEIEGAGADEEDERVDSQESRHAQFYRHCVQIIRLGIEREDVEFLLYEAEGQRDDISPEHAA